MYVSNKIHFCFSNGRIEILNILENKGLLPVPVPARSKAQVCRCSPAEIVGSNLTGGMDVCLL